jgi:exodeoxyribonuclease VII large subunit
MDRSRTPTAEPKQTRNTLSVSQLTALIKQTLQTAFPQVWVSGELSDVSRPSSGHSYFTLKDQHAQIRGVMWRSTASEMRFEPRDGQQVVCLASLDVYPPRGGYQLIVRRMEPLGVGALQRALEQLRSKLAVEGLFDSAHKKSLPRFPNRIGLITSPTGAALRDFLEVMRRRWKGTHVLVLPVRVQGDGAAREIAGALRVAQRIVPPLDVLVVARGGGSLEDLWCFNEEPVVRAIYASRIPVISAIGHEIDVTLSDLVADVRALTPSEAAERVAPSEEEILERLRHYQHRLQKRTLNRLSAARNRLEGLAHRPALSRPQDLLNARRRRIDELHLRAARLVRRHTTHVRQVLAGLAARLESLSPLAVLDRGYSITQTETRKLVRSVKRVVPGDVIVTRVVDGEVVSRVESTEELQIAKGKLQNEN